MIPPDHFGDYSQSSGQQTENSVEQTEPSVEQTENSVEQTEPSAQSSQRATRPTRKSAAGKKNVQKRAPGAKSLNSTYKRLIPILTDDDDNTNMDIDVEVLSPQANESHDVKDPVLHCMYCQDVGTYIWECTSTNCGVLACVGMANGDHGCIDATPDEITNYVKVDASTFRCPQCYRADSMPLPYKIRGYSVRQEFTHRNYFPLLAVFLSWSGFGREYASDIVRRTLREQFHLVPSRLRIASRKLKGGNNRPNAVKPDFDWLASLNYHGNLLIFIDTHSDTVTGDLVVSGNAANSNAVPVYELLENYLGENLRLASNAIAKINSTSSAGPFIRGIVVSSCGSTGRVAKSISRLKRLVEMNIVDFVFSFAGVSTVDALVVPALSRFVENVFVYNMGIWAALERSFGEDRHALNSSPVMLSFAEFQPFKNDTRKRVVDTRVLAYSNFKDARPWGLDIYRCSNKRCGAHAHDMIFHADGKQFYGKKWLKTQMKTTCMKCGVVNKKIDTPSWVYLCDAENLGRVWYRWPLNLTQQMDIGITH